MLAARRLTLVSLLVQGQVVEAGEAALSAKAAYNEGRRLIEAGDYGSGCPLVARSNVLEAAPDALLFVATCHEQEGKLAAAWKEYSQVVSAADASPKLRDVAERKARTLEPKLSSLSIAVTDSSIPGLRVRRNGDDVPADHWGVSVRVDPGDQMLEATAPGKRPWSNTIYVE